MFKILIAEDDLELRQLFRHVLLKNGYTVKGVSDGQEALDALEKDYYDLIISDIMMPNMDGYELVRSLRDAGDSIPVLMVTAKDAFDDMRMGFLSGMVNYLVLLWDGRPIRDAVMSVITSLLLPGFFIHTAYLGRLEYAEELKYEDIGDDNDKDV